MSTINIHIIVDYIWEKIELSGILSKNYDILEIPICQISEECSCPENEIIRLMEDILDEFKRQYTGYIADIEFIIDNIVIEV